MTHTGAQCLLQSPSSHTLKLSPPLAAKPFTREYLWNLWGGGVFWRHLVAMKHEAGWQKLANIFPEATHEDMGVEGRFPLLHSVNHLTLHKVYMCAHHWHRCVSVMQDGKKTFRSINTHTAHSFQTNPQPQKHHSYPGVMTFPVVISSVLFVSLHFPLGQHCLRGFHVMTNGFNMGWNN